MNTTVPENSIPRQDDPVDSDVAAYDSAAPPDEDGLPKLQTDTPSVPATAPPSDTAESEPTNAISGDPPEKEPAVPLSLPPATMTPATGDAEKPPSAPCDNPQPAADAAPSSQPTEAIESAVMEKRIAALEAICKTLEERLSMYQETALQLKETAQILDETTKRLATETEKLQEVRNAGQHLQTEISRTTHWLENTNKRYQEIMQELPNRTEKAYASLILHHNSKYKQMMLKLSDLIQKEVIKPPKAANYYLIAGIAAIQTLLLCFLLR